jgi:hypothetical protein
MMNIFSIKQPINYWRWRKCREEMGTDHLQPVRKEVGVCVATSLGLDQWDNVSARNAAKNCLINGAYLVTRYIARSASL